MDKESMLQAAEDEWLGLIKWKDSYIEECNWHWFWLILAESIWPTPEEYDEDTTLDFLEWLITGE